MGSPEFAVPSLELLAQHGYTIAGVVTAPDKPRGRGKKMGFSEVKQKALELNLPVLQPSNLKDPGFINDLQALNANLQVVVAFRMLPEKVWSMPALGTFNLHASLLPRYRGAAPIHHAIMNGEKMTGITTFFLKHEIDTGDLIFQEEEPILDGDNVGTLYERLKIKGADLVLKTVEAIADERVITRPQEGEITQAPKITRHDCKIRWDKPAEKIRNHIRGLTPFPGAFTFIDNMHTKIFDVTVDRSVSLPAGNIYIGGRQMWIGCIDNAVEVHELMIEGRKRMKTADFLNGYSIQDYQIVTK